MNWYFYRNRFSPSYSDHAVSVITGNVVFKGSDVWLGVDGWFVDGLGVGKRFKLLFGAAVESVVVVYYGVGGGRFELGFYVDGGRGGRFDSMKFAQILAYRTWN